MSERLRLGDMLVAAGLVTEAQVREALAEQRTTGQRLGVTLVAMGHVTEGQMTQVLSNQLSIPWANLYHVDFSRELLELVPAAVAEQYRLIPVYVRHIRRQGDTLYVAMEDPLSLEGLQVVADEAGMPVKPMVASPSDIENAIRVYYLDLPPITPPAPVKPARRRAPTPPTEELDLAEEDLQLGDLPAALPPSAETPPEGPAAAPEAKEHGAQAAGTEHEAEAPGAPETAEAAETEEHEPEEPELASPEAAGTEEAEVEEADEDEAQAPEQAPELTEPEAQAEELADRDSAPAIGPSHPPPASRAASRARFMTLTLLDGTQVRLPSKPRAKPPPEESSGPIPEPGPDPAERGLTTRDLIHALTARAAGEDVSNVLSEDDWEPLLAALLSILMRKGLVADWEFVDEWKKHRKK